MRKVCLFGQDIAYGVGGLDQQRVLYPMPTAIISVLIRCLGSKARWRPITIQIDLMNICNYFDNDILNICSVNRVMRRTVCSLHWSLP